VITNYNHIKDRKIKFGLAGCGRISPNHIGAIEKHSNNAQITAVCDTNAEALKEAQNKTSAKGYLNYLEMVENADIDAVILATPSGIHPYQTILAAKNKKHVISEKPMAVKWHDGLKMVKVCDENNVLLFVVKQNRRNQTLQMLKRAVEEKRFGKIYMVNINVFWARPQSYYDQANWRGTWEFDGGALMNQASHYIDLIDWLIGPVESIHAFTSTLDRKIEAEDTAVLNIKWRSGTLGSVNVSMLTYPKNLEGSITILGEKGTVRVGGLAVNEILHWEFEDKKPEDDKIKEANYETTSVYGFGHPLFYDNVINTLRGEAEPETDGREGLKSLEILIASYMSSRDKKIISLPLNL